MSTSKEETLEKIVEILKTQDANYAPASRSIINVRPTKDTPNPSTVRNDLTALGVEKIVWLMPHPPSRFADCGTPAYMDRERMPSWFKRLHASKP